MTTAQHQRGLWLYLEGMSPGSANEPPVVPPASTSRRSRPWCRATHAINGPDFTVTLTGTGFFAKSLCFVGGPDQADGVQR